MPLIVGLTMPNVIDKDIGNGTAFIAPLTKQHIERVSEACKLLTGWRWIVEKIQHERGVEAQPRTVDQVTDEIFGRMQESRRASESGPGPVVRAKNDCSGRFRGKEARRLHDLILPPQLRMISAILTAASASTPATTAFTLPTLGSTSMVMDAPFRARSQPARP
ncbi:hypothetical protein AWB66_06275 [Caballeronia telluris]|uniref:Uncharacterized protein n=1 Tax=Caballeronia telluris TaxID=326475 RepID=A0A158KHF2_9BURK|nr:hypothetical protein AWB66_06275 [Caballeronia telluris]